MTTALTLWQSADENSVTRASSHRINEDHSKPTDEQ
jgi:hypothetical protein